MMFDAMAYRHDELQGARVDTLFGQYNNWHRAEVVETNDPLNMYRVRFKCPELHDFDLKKDEYPWALPAPGYGGPKSGSWHSPCIGDIIWICWEEGHLYSPLWVGGADPTRRKYYTLPSIYIVTPLPVDEKGEPAEHPNDYDTEYLPMDERPMSQGSQDRYGSLDMISSTGYFPFEHTEPPPEPDYDAIQKKDFDQSQKPPKVNEPDKKYMLRLSKYGHVMILGDQGYWWQKGESDSDEFGEFTGDWEKDEEWEVKRWKYLQRLLNEGESKETDQRRMMLLTRYGSKIEIRDVGWAQEGPIESHTRQDEYGDPRKLSKEEYNDQRWIKLRTKGGMLIQMYDKGFDPEEDEFIKRKLIDEVGDKTELENQHWGNKDSRWMRFVTRHGYKIVLDDRGSDSQKAEEKENPHGNGILFKGRRSPGAEGKKEEGDERGFYWEFNENDDTNQTTWGTPLGLTAQMSDKLQYFMVSVARRRYATEYKKLEENEFLLDPLVNEDTELKTHHLKIDHHNEYIRLKTRAKRGSVPWGEIVNPAVRGEQQGMEARDGEKGDGPWLEMVDIDRRGIWCSNKNGLTVGRGRTTESGTTSYAWWFNEPKTEVAVYNNASGYFIPPPEGSPAGTPPTFVPARIQIFCRNDVEIIANEGKINIKAQKQIAIQSDTRVLIRGGGAFLELSGRNPKMRGALVVPGIIEEVPPIRTQIPPEPITRPQMQPNDRGKRYNGPLEEPIDRDEIEHPVIEIAGME